MATIGLLVGRENTFPEPFIEHVNARHIPGISAEMVKLGGTPLNADFPYRVIVDRISHEVPYYRCYLKAAALRGTVVINDPFWWGSDDKFLECLIAERVGVAVPRTLLVPNKSYVEGITSESLRNLQAPLDWDAMLDYVGRPAILKPAIGGGWKNVYKVNDAAALVRCFDESGQLQMILQEFIEFEHYVRCICLGRVHIQPIRYNPHAPFHERYVVDDNYLAPDLRERVVSDARKLVEALGYDMDTVEFAIRDGVPYAIDFLNPAPDFDRFSITPHYFDWVIQTMADLVIAYAQGEAESPHGYVWHERPFRPTPPESPFATSAPALPPTALPERRRRPRAGQASGAAAQASGAAAQARSAAATVTATPTQAAGKAARATGTDVQAQADGVPEESAVARAARPRRTRKKTE